MAEVLGVLSSPRGAVAAVESLKQAGFGDLEVYSPVPSHEIEHAVGKGPSWVRLWTLIGGLTGVATGYLMTIWMAYDSGVVIGGKPFASIPAYTVIAFELNILIGGILTVIGLLVHGLWLPKGDHTAFRPNFSIDQFGCVVTCATDQIQRVQELLEQAGSTEVRVVQG